MAAYASRDTRAQTRQPVGANRGVLMLNAGQRGRSAFPGGARGPQRPGGAGVQHLDESQVLAKWLATQHRPGRGVPAAAGTAAPPAVGATAFPAAAAPTTTADAAQKAAEEEHKTLLAASMFAKWKQRSLQQHAQQPSAGGVAGSATIPGGPAPGAAGGAAAEEPKGGTLSDTGSIEMDPVKNSIAEALYLRLCRAIENKERFRVYILLPVHPDGKFALQSGPRGIK